VLRLVMVDWSWVSSVLGVAVCVFLLCIFRAKSFISSVHDEGSTSSTPSMVHRWLWPFLWMADVQRFSWSLTERRVASDAVHESHWIW